MAFPIGSVPIPGRPQPLQIPQHYDPASIIMQAAAMRQQRDMESQRLQAQSVQGLIESVQTAAHLKEQQREADQHNAIAQATLALQQGKVPMEEAQMGAHIGLLQAQQKLAEAQAGMLGGNSAVTESMKKVHEGLTAPSQFFGGFSARNGQQAAMRNLYNSIYPNDSEAQLEASYQKNISGQKALGGQAPTVQKIDSLFTQINRFDKLASMVPKTAMDAINRMGLQLAAQNGPADVKIHAANLLQQTRILSDEAQSTFGSGSDAKLALGSAIFDPNPNPATIMADNQIARYSLLSRRNGLAGQPDNFLPPSFNSLPPRERVSSYLNRMKGQNINAQSVVPVVHQMVQSGLLDDDILGK